VLHRWALLEAVKSGDIEIISSDHSPAPPDMKELESGDFLKAWGGISGEVGAPGCFGMVFKTA
jgi:allantoinase